MYNLLRISSIWSGKKFSSHCRSRLANVGDLPLVDIPIFKSLLYISKNSGGKAVLTSAISREEKIPRKFLESILRSLRNNQILHSKRGKEGGFLLLRDPKEIYIVEIMRIMDGPVAMLPCVSLNYYQSCEECDEESCTIKGMFENIRDKTLEILGGTSLYDLNHQL